MRQHRIQKAKAHLGLAFKLGVFLECADVDFRLCQALLQPVDLGARFEATSAAASRVVALVADTVSEARLDAGATPPFRTLQSLSHASAYLLTQLVSLRHQFGNGLAVVGRVVSQRSVRLTGGISDQLFFRISLALGIKRPRHVGANSEHGKSRERYPALSLLAFSWASLGSLSAFSPFPQK